MDNQYQYKTGDEVIWKNHDGRYLIKSHQYKTMPSLVKIINALTGKWYTVSKSEIEPIKQKGAA